MNIQLQEYFVMLQNALDCHYFYQDFDVPFFKKKKVMFTKELDTCMNNLQSADFLEKCERSCQAISLSQINWLVEGDLDYIEEALTYFNRLYR